MGLLLFRRVDLSDLGLRHGDSQVLKFAGARWEVGEGEMITMKCQLLRMLMRPEAAAGSKC